LLNLSFDVAVMGAASAATHLTTTPSLFATLSATGWTPERLPSLRVVALGGEYIPKSMAQSWAAAVTLANTYGVTECCVYQVNANCAARTTPSHRGHIAHHHLASHENGIISHHIT
jgi:acyl-coenzyme A synthetase/AMP-(fatty) acid ligase